MYVDTHAHLFAPEFKDDLEGVMARARDAGVDFIIVPGTDLETSRQAIALAERFPAVRACVGVHPHEAASADDVCLAEIEELSRHPAVVGIGEIGLDYHYTPPGNQRSVFAKQIEIAARRDLPIVIHCRDAETDTLDIISDKVSSLTGWRSRLTRPHDRYPPPKGVFHCFPGDASMARTVINWGFFISIPGPVTFGDKPKPNLMARVVSEISAEHILLETDSPYLSPAPKRGKRNEPSAIPIIAQKIADLQNLSLDDIARTSSFGALSLFGVGSYPPPAIAYRIRNSLYLNITIRCNADCVFCDRKGAAVIKGHNLRITEEPSVDEIIRAIGDPARFEEIVFCGYGEPTIRLDALLGVSKWVKSRRGRVRLNTDGHGNIINGRNIVPQLVGVVDSVSISLNSTDPDQYGKLMRIDGESMFSAMVEFSRQCVKHGLDVTMTAVELDEVDRLKARSFAENTIGARFKQRLFF